jgi:methyl-accepting chemotaxis protein
MFVDGDFRITYVNETTRALLRRHADLFRAHWPAFDPDRIVGQSMDMFHKNPAHQRGLVSDGARLPHRANIQVGPLTFELHISAMTDPRGRPAGAMLEWGDITDRRDLEATSAAISRAQAVIEFSMDGTIVTANDNFLNTLGYRLEEIQGKHHSMFVEASYRDSPDYRAFWDALNRGEFQAAQYKRIGKNGKEVWIQATYNPILGPNGRPTKVVKFATDITAEKLRQADFEGQLAAIDKAQAVIEFALDGTVLRANDNFLAALGYRLEEVKGKHHSLFVEPSYRASAEYRLFWDKLGRGEYDAAQYKRIRKDGTEIWIQASYNPIFDPSGRPYKVVKYASDVTEQVRMSQALDATVREARATVQAAVDGDLMRRVPTEGKSGQIAELAASVNTLIETMMTLVERIKRAAGEVHSGAQEIAKGNLNLSQRTEEQASSLEETASSMEEMTSTVKTTADNASQANQLASTARQQSEKGGTVVGAAIAAMSGINAASKKIADIIGVIDEIAFQTNLLALNAAVEAARAGEQGRGFAVVATEVRNLAGRSATAAKEIKALINDSVAKIQEGSALVDESGKALSDIGTAVKRVTDVVAEIASASQEQAAGIEQVNKAVVQMDEVTQQNAALVEEAAAASEAIVEQARTLSELVARYRVGNETEIPTAEPAPSAAPAAERRGAARPWSNRPAPAARAAESGAPKAPQRAIRTAAASSGSDHDWEAF